MKNIKVKNIIAFLKSRGWTLDGTTETHYLMKPPKEMKPAPDVHFYLVREKFEDVPEDYLENMMRATRNIAEIYGLDYYLLTEMFSKTKEEMELYRDISSQVLANVA